MFGTQRIVWNLKFESSLLTITNQLRILDIFELRLIRQAFIALIYP